jgi:hypothetical protein
MAMIKPQALKCLLLPALVLACVITSDRMALAQCTSGAFCNGGNAFGGTATLGTTDTFGLNLETNTIPRLTIDPSGSIGLSNLAPAARLHIGSSTAPEAIGALFELPPNPLSDLPSIQWQGGGNNGFGKWRNYVNGGEKTFLLSYNMPFNYTPSANQFEGRDVVLGPANTAYLWYDGVEGAYNFWSMGFGAATGLGGMDYDLQRAGSFTLRQGSGGNDGNGQGVVPTLFDVRAPTNADAVYQLVTANAIGSGTGVAFVASGNSSTPNQLSIKGYNPFFDAPCAVCPQLNPPPADAVKTLMTMHTDTGNVSADTGDLAIATQSKGLILKATNGPNCYRVTVNNAGSLKTASVSCP